MVAWFVWASAFHSVNYALSANGGSNPAQGMEFIWLHYAPAAEGVRYIN